MNYYDELVRTEPDPLAHHIATMRRFARNFDGWRDTCVITTHQVLPSFNLLSWIGNEVGKVGIPICILFMPYNAATRMAAEIGHSILVIKHDSYEALITGNAPIPWPNGYSDGVKWERLWLRYHPQDSIEGMAWQSARERVKREQSQTPS